MIKKQGLVGKIQPFPMEKLTRGTDGIIRYVGVDATLVSMLDRARKTWPKAEALVECGGERLSYAQLWERSASVAGGLKAAGIGVGDRVGLDLPNGISWVVAFFGTLLAGGVIVPINTRLSKTEKDYAIADSGAKFIFEPGQQLPQASPFVYENASNQDLAAIFYTSGTTGHPKGAMTSHENFISNVETAIRVARLEPEDLRSLVSVPLFHVTGCNSQLLPTLSIGGTIVMMPSFDVGSFISTIAQEKITVLTSVPAIYWLAMNQPQFLELDTSAVTRVLYGGAPTPPELVKRIIAAFGNAEVGNGFGLSETASISTFLPHAFAATRPETVGFAAPPVELDLHEVDPQTGAGELLIKGPNVVSGYWNKPEATSSTFIDGWLHSGDMAKIDDSGFCQIVDRKKDMVNRGGENVYCVEVENVLIEYPGVFEVAIVGVPDPMMGEKVGAVVVPMPGTQLDTNELIEFASSKLATYKVPQFLKIQSEPLPRNPGGKVLKPILRSATDWGNPLR